MMSKVSELPNGNFAGPTDRIATVQAGELTGVAIGDVRIRLKEDNAARLAESVAIYGKAIPGMLVDQGDSLIANNEGSPVIGSIVRNDYDAGEPDKPEHVDTHNTATFRISQVAEFDDMFNFAEGGRRTDENLAAFGAMTAAQKAADGTTSGLTNNLAQISLVDGQHASGVTSASIDAAGAGGTDGTYTVPTINGAAANGENVTPASYEVTVTGGAITSATPVSIGGGYVSAPDFDLSGIPGLAGATLTAELDALASIESDLSDIMDAGGPDRLLMPGWVGVGVGQRIYAMSRAVMAWAKAQAWGNRVIDALQLFASNTDGSAASLADVLSGQIADEHLADATHNDDRGINLLGDVRGFVTRSQKDMIGPYIHPDDVFVARPGDAAGTAIGGLRVRGDDRLGIRIVGGNHAGQVQLDDIYLERGAGDLPPVTEVVVEGESLQAGKGNLARQVILRGQDGTGPVPVLVKGNGGSWLQSDVLDGGQLTAMTAVFTARFPQSGGFGSTIAQLLMGALGTVGSPILQQFLNKTRLRLVDAGGNLVSHVDSPEAADPTGWNTYLLSFNSAAGNESLKATVNGGAVTNGVAPPTGFALDFERAMTLFHSSGAPLVNAPVEQLGFYPAEFDIGDAGLQGQFCDVGTGRAKDIGNAQINGVDPIVFFNGDIGDWFTGANRGTGGAFYGPPYAGAAHLGFGETV